VTARELRIAYRAVTDDLQVVLRRENRAQRVPGQSVV